MFDFNRHQDGPGWSPYWPTIIIYWFVCILVGGMLGAIVWVLI